MLASTGPVGTADAIDGAGAVNATDEALSTAEPEVEAAGSAPDVFLQPSGAIDDASSGTAATTSAINGRELRTIEAVAICIECPRDASVQGEARLRSHAFLRDAVRSAMMERLMDGYPSVGTIIAGRYRIDALLGEGGMGAVFRASDSQGSAFALKFPAPEIRSRPGMMSRFANEAVAASRIASEHAVHIFGVEATEGGVPFIVMELLQGTDLDQIIEAQAPVEIPRAVHFSLQVLRALQVAHAAGVVHRDMKPANCFVMEHNGEPDFIKIIDFGITKLLGDDAANMTRTSVTMGTPAYMSPEQARSAKAAEPRSDLYAVGVILYELLSKKRPYEGDSHNELVVKICTEPPMPIRNVRPDLPAELATAVERALVKIPAGRFESAQAFARSLAPFADARSQGVLQRIEAGVQPSALAAALAPTPLASSPGSPPASPGNRTAIMEPGAAFDAPPAPVGREPQRTVVADAPIAFAEPPPAAFPPSGASAVVPAAPSFSESHPSRGGGGRGGLIAVLGVLAIGLVFGGLYFGGVFGGGSTAAPPPAPTTAAAEEGDDEPTKKKKKKSADDPDEPAEPPPTEPTTTSPTATKPAVTKPPTTGTTTAPKPSTSTPGTTTAPTIVLPPGFPFPSGTTSAPPPAGTTTPPPVATTAPPPATTSAPPPATTAPPAMTIPVIKKPKIGGG
jgi:serine/threonine protein kinase